MHRNWLVLTSVILVLLLVALGWVLLSSPAPIDDAMLEKPRTTELPASSPFSDVAQTPAATSPQITTQPFSAESQPEHPLTPVFGPLLERSKGEVIIRLFDGQGRPVSASFAGSAAAVAWRKQGGHWQRYEGAVHADKSLAHFGKELWSRLPEGEYAYEIALGGYGSHEGTFTILDGQHLERAAHFAPWVRTITLEFRDAKGKPLPFISPGPQYVPPPLASQPGSRTAPGTLLRGPPREDILIDFEIEEAFESMEEISLSFCDLDEKGCIEIEVLAGTTKGQLELKISPPLFEAQEPQVFQPPFDGSRWDRLVFTATRVDLPEGAAKALAKMGQLPSSYLKTPPSPIGSSTNPRRKVIFNKPWSSADFRILHQGHMGPMRGHPRDAQLTVEFATLRKEPKGKATFEVTDQALYFERFAIDPDVSNAAEAIRLPRQGASIPTTLSVRSSPTLSAWATWVTMHVISTNDHDFDARLYRLPLRAADSRGHWHVYESGLSGSALERLRDQGAELWLACSPARRSVAGPPRHFHFQLNEEEVDQLAAGRLKLDLATLLAERSTRGHLLAFRCLDPEDSPVPWIEGSIVPLADDQLAQELRRVMVAAREAGNPIDTAIDYDPGFDSGSILEFEELDPQSDRYRDFGKPIEHVPPRSFSTVAWEFWLAEVMPKTRDLMPQRQLRRLFRMATWYDSSLRVMGDRDGYAVSARLPLIPGQRYALYLWGPSRDPLKPDARYVFDATPGITDLGVLRMNPYD